MFGKGIKVVRKKLLRLYCFCWSFILFNVFFWFVGYYIYFVYFFYLESDVEWSCIIENFFVYLMYLGSVVDRVINLWVNRFRVRCLFNLGYFFVGILCVVYKFFDFGRLRDFR